MFFIKEYTFFSNDLDHIVYIFRSLFCLFDLFVATFIVYHDCLSVKVPCKGILGWLHRVSLGWARTNKTNRGFTEFM